MKITSKIKSVCVYCSASVNINDKYKEPAGKLGSFLAQEKIRLVFGGGRLGLMGIISNACMEAGGKVLGITTKHLDQYEVGHHGLTELRIVDNMHARKHAMFEEADAFIILPGGFGTLEEVFEVLTWKQIGLHDKPILFVNLFGFWNPLKELLAHIVDEKFASNGDAHLYSFVDKMEKVIPTLESLPRLGVNPTTKWNYTAEELQITPLKKPHRA